MEYNAVQEIETQKQNLEYTRKENTHTHTETERKVPFTCNKSLNSFGPHVKKRNSDETHVKHHSSLAEIVIFWVFLLQASHGCSVLSPSERISWRRIQERSTWRRGFGEEGIMEWRVEKGGRAPRCRPHCSFTFSWFKALLSLAWGFFSFQPFFFFSNLLMGCRF